MMAREGHRTTSFDVAKAAGVSRTTVSLVLNNVPDVNISEATRQRVVEAARTLKYFPDAAGKKLVSGKSYTLGLVLRQSSAQVFADAFLLQVLFGVEQAAAQRGFHVLLRALAPEDTEGYSRLIQENHVDGIILSGPRQDDRDLIHMSEAGVAIMLMGQLPGSEIPYVDIDAVRDARMAVEHLIAAGHTRIAMITNAPLAYISAQQRCQGYRDALNGHGLSVDPEWIIEGNFTPESGLVAMARLLALAPRPTAVFVASDVVAMGAVRAAKQAGLEIPHDLAIIGFDDIPLAEYFDPPLSTIHLPAYGLGWAAAERLIRIINNEGLDQSGILLTSELVIRQSSGPPPG
jgi:DNA-binding LacI/PurR family transcriptional regulator